MNDGLIGYREAFELTLAHITPSAAKVLPFSECTDHINGEDLVAKVYEADHPYFPYFSPAPKYRKALMRWWPKNTPRDSKTG